MRNLEGKKEETNMICPITGSKLIYLGCDPHVMDPNSYYSPKSDSSIIFANHPFSYDIYTLVSDTSIMAQELRYFKLNNKIWTELKKIPYTDKLVPLDYPIQDYFIEAGEGLREYKKYLAYRETHPKEFPTSQLIPMEQVSIHPLSPPSGKLMCLDSSICKKMNFFQRIALRYRNWRANRNVLKYKEQ